MKKIKIYYWLSTGFVFLFDTVIPAFTSNTQVAIDSIHNLGFPDYFRIQLTVFKIGGGLLLILPKIPRRYKEWAYAGFAFNFISAAVANGVVYGIGFFMIIPLIILSILIVSYINYNRILNSITVSESYTLA